MTNRKILFKWTIATLLAPYLVIGACTSPQGCTDPSANNFNASSRYDDSSCLYKEIDINPDSFVDLKSKFNENSGLVYFSDRIWTFNDGGGETKIYSIDTTDGGELENIFLNNTSNTDWEDVCKDPTHIYVGDFGNNYGNRTDLKIYSFQIFPDSSIKNNNSTSVSVISYAYPDQKDFRKDEFTNYDCEAMVASGEYIYIFSKRHGDQRTAAYRIPKIPGKHVAELMGYFQVNGLITGADLSPSGNCLALTMCKDSDNTNYVWLFRDFNQNSFFTGKKTILKLGSRDNFGQIEGICFKDDQQLYLSGELYGRVSPTIWKLNIRNL